MLIGRLTPRRFAIWARPISGLEDGAFNSGRVRIGAGCTIGTRAYVSYATVLEPDPFLMKGETTSARSVLRGDSARETAR